MFENTKKLSFILYQGYQVSVAIVNQQLQHCFSWYLAAPGETCFFSGSSVGQPFAFFKQAYPDNILHFITLVSPLNSRVSVTKEITQYVTCDQFVNYICALTFTNVNLIGYVCFYFAAMVFIFLTRSIFQIRKFCGTLRSYMIGYL